MNPLEINSPAALSQQGNFLPRASLYADEFQNHLPCAFRPMSNNYLLQFQKIITMIWFEILYGANKMLLEESSQIITKSKDILSGTPVFAGTRVPIQTLFDYLEAGDSLNEFLDDFPTVTREIAIKVLELLKKATIS